MTRHEQVMLIKRSVVEWNHWRTENTCIPADLQGANLRGARLLYAHLQDANLRCANLQYADLQGANLRGARLQYANLRGAHLQGANLRGAHLQYGDLQYGDSQDAYLQYANLQGAYLQDAYFRHVIRIEAMTCRVYRSDDYLFIGFATNAGLMINAGCRLLSPDDYRKHVAKEYPGTPKAKETLRIIQYIENCAKEQE